MGKWKAVRLNVSSNPDAPIELYDLDKDLAEKNNIAGNHPEIVEKMNKTMKQARVHTDKWPLYRKTKGVKRKT